MLRGSKVWPSHFAFALLIACGWCTTDATTQEVRGSITPIEQFAIGRVVDGLIAGFGFPPPEPDIFVRNGAASQRIHYPVLAVVDLNATAAVDSVQFALDGSLNSLDRTFSGRSLASGEFAGLSGNFEVYSGFVNLAEAEALDGLPTPPVDEPTVFNATLRGFAWTGEMSPGPGRAAGSVDGFDAADSESRVFVIRDLTQADGADGNGKPDGSALVRFPNGRMETVVNGVPVVSRWAPPEAELFDFPATLIILTLDLPGGDTVVGVQPPSLNTLKLSLPPGEFPEIENAADARVIFTVAPTAAVLVPDAGGVNPGSQFDLGTPAPENLFIHVDYLVRSADSVANGTAEWSAVTDFPPDVEGTPHDMTVFVLGSSVRRELDGLSDAFVYTYETDFNQDPDNLDLIQTIAPEDGVWEESTVVNIFQFLVGSSRAPVADGADIISVSLRRAGVIISSDVMPRMASPGSDSDNCFIATAAYGTPLAREIDVLRRFRDNRLLGNPLGAAFVDTYYRISPPLARHVAAHDSSRKTARGALRPVIYVAGFANRFWTALILAGVALAFSAAGIRLRRAI